MRNQFNFFDYKFGKNIKFLVFRLTKSAFQLNRFLFVDMLFFRVRQNNQLFSSLSSNLLPCLKYGFVAFYRELTKLATGVSFFVPVASAVTTVGPGVP